MQPSRWRRVARDLLIGTLVATVTLIAVLGGLEAFFRYQEPFHSTYWPAHFDPRVGFVFIPHSELRWTNGLDFWTVQRANKWGFLDREPADTPPAADECRVALIGDFFVEAAQVPIADKQQVVLEALARDRAPALRITTSAFGHSGTGQLNQLPFYDEFVRQWRPKVVVLVFVENDFANNSNVLEALRHGWDPDRAPRLFAKRDPSGQFMLQPIDPRWAEAMLAKPERAPALRARWHALMSEQSALYRWVYSKLLLLHPAIAKAISGGDMRSLIDFNARQVAQRPPYRNILQGWDPVREPDIDSHFDREHLAPVFEEAIQYTGFAFDEFLERARRDHFSLMVLAGSGVGARSRGLWMLNRLTALLKVRGIPLVDHAAHIVSVGGPPRGAHFPHDPHWSPQGHQWAAQAVLQFLLANPAYCRD